MEEQFKTINDFDNYEVSNTGKIRMKSNNHIIGTTISKGYVIVRLIKNDKKHTKNIHRLVAEYFFPNFESNMFVEHKDKNKNNNIVSNLVISYNKKKSSSYKKNNKIIDLNDFDKLEAKRQKGLLNYDEHCKLIEMYNYIDRNKAKERTIQWRLKKQILTKMKGIEEDELQIK